MDRNFMFSCIKSYIGTQDEVIWPKKCFKPPPTTPPPLLPPPSPPPPLSRLVYSTDRYKELILVFFVHLFDLHLFVLSVFFSSWCLGSAALCDCGTPWNFSLIPFFPIIITLASQVTHVSQHSKSTVMT